MNKVEILEHNTTTNYQLNEKASLNSSDQYFDMTFYSTPWAGLDQNWDIINIEPLLYFDFCDSDTAHDSKSPQEEIHENDCTQDEYSSVESILPTTELLEKPPMITEPLNERSGWENYLVCNIYNKQFHSNCTLSGKIKASSHETTPYRCNICKKYFTRKGSLVRHERVHTGEKPYKCDLCNQYFTEKGTLMKHVKMHTGDKPFKCDICGKRFTWRSGCVNHRRVHTGEKPFVCVVCKKGFNLRGNLDKHKKVHDGEKPFNCEVCGKCFSEKGTLKRHVRLHTGEKPYKCNICHKKFSEKGNLKVHKKGHVKIYHNNVRDCLQKVVNCTMVSSTLHLN